MIELKNNPADNFFLLAGPCVIEGEEMAMRIAERVVKITEALQIPYVFKGSYRKANRSRLDSFTGIGDEKALKVLQKVRDTFGVPTVTDIHSAEEAEMAAKEPDPTPLDIAKGILDKLGCTTASYRLIVDIDPAERILEYAKTAEADMIVLGNRGMGMLAELLMGSVSMKISQYAECPVVIVK